MVFHASPLSWWNWNLEIPCWLCGGKKPDNLIDENPQSKATTNSKLIPHMSLGGKVQISAEIEIKFHLYIINK